MDKSRMTPLDRAIYEELVAKYNPYHDSKGRFASRDGAHGYSAPKNPKHLKNENIPEHIKVITRTGADGNRVKQTGLGAVPTPPQKPARQFKQHKIFRKSDLDDMTDDELRKVALEVSHEYYRSGKAPGYIQRQTEDEYMDDMERYIAGYTRRSIMTNIKDKQQKIHGKKAYDAAQKADFNKSEDLVKATGKKDALVKSMDLDVDLQKTLKREAAPYYHNAVPVGGKSAKMAQGSVGYKGNGTYYLNDDSRNISSGGWTGTTKDRLLSKIYEKQGYNAKPDKVSGADLNKMIKSGKVKEIFRWFNSQQTKDSFEDGDTHYVGSGIFGNGTYCGDKNWNRRNPVAQNYGTKGIRMGLKADAKVAKWDKLTKEHTAFLNDPKVDARDKILLGTPSRFAAAKGYDAYIVPKKINTSGGTADYYVLLNRGAVVVDKDFK